MVTPWVINDDKIVLQVFNILFPVAGTCVSMPQK